MLFQLFRLLVNPLIGKGLSRYKYLNYIYRKIGGIALYGTRQSKIVVIDSTKFFLLKGSRGLEGVEDCLLINGEYEVCTTNILELLIKPGMKVIDVGANIGYYTLLFSKLVGEEGFVYAFEPEKLNLRKLLINLELNGSSNVSISSYAVSNREGSSKLYISDSCSGEHSLVTTRNREMKTVDVSLTTLDSYIKEDKIDLIKIDTEGNEIQVLLGAKNLLKRSEDILLVVEAWPYGLADSGKSIKELWELLDAFGFSCKYRLDDPNCKVYPVELPYLESRNSKDHEAVNLLCSRKPI